MVNELEIVRKSMEKISVSGRENIEIMGLCMDAIDEIISKMKEEEEKNHETD